MNTLSIPMVAMAGISLYVGFYHLLIYFRHRQSRADLMFTLLCFAYVFYAAFCAGLYNATSVIEGMQWQRAQFIALAFFVTAFVWFVSEYTYQKPGIATYLFSIFYLLAIVVQSVDRSELTFLADQPSIKSITLPYVQPITYSEATLGPFTAIQGLMGVVASTYILIMGIRYFKRGYKREAVPLILAIILMYAAGLHDTLVSNGVYHFIYLIEYAYLAVILLMANSLSILVVEAAIAKENLRQSEERFRALVETTSDWVWEVDSNGVYTYASPKIRDLLGYEPEEVLGRTPFDLMSAEEAERVRAIFQDIVSQKKSLERVENIACHKDGQFIVLETSGVPFFDDYGGLLGYRGIDRDITERKRAEQALQVKTEELDRYFTSSLDLLCIADTDGYFHRLNPEWERTLGYAIAELEGQQFLEFVHPDDLEATHAAISRLAAQAEILNFENRYRCKDGSYRWIEWRSYPMEKMIYAVARDITRRKQVEEALQQTNLMIENSTVVLFRWRAVEGWPMVMVSQNVSQFGYTSEELLSETVTFASLIHPEDLDRVVREVQEYSSSDTDRFQQDYRLITKDGQVRWVDDRTVIERNANGQITFYQGIIIDVTERKHAVEALREKNHFIASLLRAIPVAVFYKDREGKYLGCNDAFAKIMGVTAEEIIGKTVYELWPSDLADKYHQMDLELMQTREHQEYEYKIKARDGQMHPVIYAKDVYLDENGEVAGLVGAFLDITERKQVEEALRESEQELRASEERYRTLVEVSPIGTWISRNQVIAYANPAALKIFGATDPNEIVGRTSFDFIHPDYHAVARERIAQMMETGKIVPLLEEKYVRLDGSVVDVEVIATPLITSEGTIIQVFFQDITKRKQAEQALRESEERLRQIASSLRETIWLRDVQTRQVLYVNPAFEQLTGWTCESFYENPNIVVDAIHPDDKEWVIEALARRIERVSYNEEHRIIHRDGSVRWVSSRSFPVRNEAGGVFRWASIMEDITARKQAETEREHLIVELENRNAELERFAYTVSHDLKTPLITIRGFLGYIEQDALSGDMNRLKGDLQRIVAATDKMQRLLNELLDLSRIGRIMNPPGNIAFGELVQDAIKLLEGRLQERNIEVKIQEDLPVVFGDSQRLLEVIQNLLDNAIKFMGTQSAPIIEIGTWDEENGSPVFYVRDNGMGIAPEHHERIFGLFNKLNPGAEGTGVGLAIVKRIVEVHGGRIWIESEEGRGATFYFTLGKGVQ